MRVRIEAPMYSDREETNEILLLSDLWGREESTHDKHITTLDRGVYRLFPYSACPGRSHSAPWEEMGVTEMNDLRLCSINQRDVAIVTAGSPRCQCGGNRLFYHGEEDNEYFLLCPVCGIGLYCEKAYSSPSRLIVAMRSAKYPTGVLWNPIAARARNFIRTEVRL